MKLPLTLLALAFAAAGQVHTLPATSIILKPANHFDLEGRTLRYTPSPGGYRMESLPLDFQTPLAPAALGATGRTNSAYGASWATALPFAFPFAGRTYNSVFVNLNGNLSFGTPETTHLPAGRNPWPDGTLRGTAAALDGRSLSGTESLIAVLWQLYSPADSRIVTGFVQGDRLIVTWNVQLRQSANAGYRPLGRNVFQAVLYAGGQIDLSYQQVSERDGITGVFTGASGTGTALDSVARPQTIAEPVVAVKNLELTDLGSALRWRFTMGAPTPASIPSGQLWYRVFLTLRGESCEISLGYTPTLRTVVTCGRGTELGFRNENGTVDLVISKLALDGATSFAWGADVIWFGFTGRFDQVNLQSRRPVQLNPAQAKPEVDFSALASAPQTRAGNIYEIFHYPSVDKALHAAPRAAYKLFAPDDDFFVPMLDFRPDDLFNHGPSTGQLGAGPQVLNIGASSNVQDFGSKKLQVAISPLYFHGPRLAEWVSDGRRDYFNYAQAVAWISHEITHRWSSFLKFRNAAGTNLPLAQGSHWLPELNVPAVHRIWSDYSFSEYPERSIMDGGLYTELGNGRFRLQELTYIIPAGFAGLDLYTMGLVSPEDMPETYWIRNRQAIAGTAEFTGQKVIVTGPDVVAEMGPRIPSAANSQKEFKLGVYLFHDPAAAGPDPAVLLDAREIALQTAHFFSRASGGRMRVNLSAATSLPAPEVRGVQNALAVNAPLLEGSVVTISGEGLASKQTSPLGDRFVSQWNGTSLTVGGQAALLRQVSPQSLEVALPPSAAGDTGLPIIVSNRRGSSEPFSLRVAPASPYLLSGGEGRAEAIRVSDGSMIDAANPVAPEEIVQLALIGLPAEVTKPAFAVGARVPTETAVELSVSLTVLFGDVEVIPESVAMAPGLAGKLLLRVKVPAELATGDVTLRVKAAEQLSNAATLPVK